MTDVAATQRRPSTLARARRASSRCAALAPAKGQPCRSAWCPARSFSRSGGSSPSCVSCRTFFCRRRWKSWTAAVSIYQDGYANASLFEHVSASLLRIFTAAAIAIVLGVPIGLLMGLNKWAKGVFDTPIEFYWPLPPLAYLPLMIIWLGIGETSKIALLALAMFAPIVLSAQAGVRSVSQERVNAALSLGATRFQLLREIVLPSALPEILTGIRISLGVGWGTLVAAELIAATRGIGYLIMSASQFLATDVVFVGIGIIAACAFAFTFAMRLLEAWLVPWKGQN